MYFKTDKIFHNIWKFYKSYPIFSVNSHQRLKTVSDKYIYENIELG